MSALTILAEECELLNDSKYRTYITQIEKALRYFETTSEWADLIMKIVDSHNSHPKNERRFSPKISLGIYTNGNEGNFYLLTEITLYNVMGVSSLNVAVFRL
jgi:hypothetical protein